MNKIFPDQPTQNFFIIPPQPQVFFIWPKLAWLFFMPKVTLTLLQITHAMQPVRNITAILHQSSAYFSMLSYTGMVHLVLAGQRGFRAKQGLLRSGRFIWVGDHWLVLQAMPTLGTVFPQIFDRHLFLSTHLLPQCLFMHIFNQT